jgi:hypothetical protein
MPRYRRYGNYGRNAAAPKPIVNKAPKLDVTGLTAAYEWLAVDRTLGLRMATEWYAANTNALLFGAPLDAARQRDYDRAAKCAALGNNNTVTGERETAWTMGLKGYEKVWDAKALPKVTDAISAADNGTVSKRIAAVKTVLDNVNGAFAPVGVRFAPSCSADRDFNEDTIWVPQAELEAMCAQPPLKLALTEATTVARVKSFVTVDGKTEMDGALFLANLPLVLEGVYAWAAQAGGSLTKPVGKVRAVKAPRAPKAPGAPSATPIRATKITAVDPFGVFARNSIRAAVTSLLADRKPHLVSDLKAFCRSNGYISNSTIGNVCRDLKAKGILIVLSGKGVKAQITIS